MKTLLLLRHGKSDWSDPSLSDMERPLAPRGMKDAPRMGKVLKRAGLLPDVIVSSPARRAFDTAVLAADACGFPHAVQIDPNLYPGSATAVAGVIRRASGEAGTLMIVGHNPALEESISPLVCSRKSAVLNVRVPTAVLICMEADVPGWADALADGFVLAWMLTPRLEKAVRGREKK
jgi:phosphohistidine phosphatase